MRPFNDINIGDIFASTQYLSQLTYEVVGKDKDSKLIETRCSYQHPSLPETVWKKTDNRVFNKRIFDGKRIS